MSYGETYEEFIAKFKHKKTTDDCYTPPEVYGVIKDWVCKEYQVSEEDIVRPFYPGGDYENFDYKKTSVVVDNPPFSILSKIISWYTEHNIPFFLFAPTLTLFSLYNENGVSYIATDCKITYESGARVDTSFVTNLEKETVVRTAPELNRTVMDTQRPGRKRAVSYKYPKELMTSTKLARLSDRGVSVKINTNKLYFIHKLDCQRPHRKKIYGDGFLLAKSLPEAVRKDIEVRPEEYDYVWELSEREKDIINKL